MASQDAVRRFCQFLEDGGLRAYDALVIQNASDIARESDRVRNQNHWAYLQEKHLKRRQEDHSKRIGEDVAMAADGSYSRKHFRLGFMTMPAPGDRAPPPSQGFSVRSQSLHSVGGEEDSGRKQPPPKPRRDPNTKLSSSAETVDGTGLSAEEREAAEHSEAYLYGEDCRKMPPPKPKRNPNTQLSSSFDDSYILSHGDRRPSVRWDAAQEDEPVYIEMVGNILAHTHTHALTHTHTHAPTHTQTHAHNTHTLREPKAAEAADDQSESVYEEMKYPLTDDLVQAAMLAPASLSRCDIPAPFPNLLTPRPPLLVFPPATAVCSPGDESPLTPLDAGRIGLAMEASCKLTLAMSTTADNNNAPGRMQPMENASRLASSMDSYSKKEQKHRDRDRDRDRDREWTKDRDQPITASGRSSAPPLPSNFYKSSGSAHSGHGYPRSQSACPSPVSRCLTPLSLKRPPPYEALVSGGNSMPRSSSSSSSQGGGAKSNPAHGSMTNVSSMRSQTPTSPLDELNNLFTAGRMKKATGRRRSRDGEAESRSLPRRGSRDRDGAQSPVSRMGRSSVSPTMMLGGGAGEPKWMCKVGRSASTSGVPSPATSHRHEKHPALSQMPWLCGDATMMEMIERKRVLCGEIRAQYGVTTYPDGVTTYPGQNPNIQGYGCYPSQTSHSPYPGTNQTNPNRSLDSWRRKQPPPYSAPPTGKGTNQSAVFWDTAI